MFIHDITIRNFKSLYGEHKFNFTNLNGLIKLSGPIGTGKTSFAEAILYGLLGTVKGQNNTQLVSWNTKECEVEINLTSKEKKVHIIRNIHKPLIVEIDGKLMPASSKRNTQEILEEEIFDIPKLAITKMCVISFNAFNSLASMNPADTKQFLDEIFGFKLFTDYNNEIIIEKKDQVNEQIKLQSVYEENRQQIENLKQKQIIQTNQLKSSIDLTGITNRRKQLVNDGVELKNKKQNVINERDEKIKAIDKEIKECQIKITEATTLGKQAKNHYNTFKSGICPTCGQKIDESHINEYKNKMQEYANIYREWDGKKKEFENTKNDTYRSYVDTISKYDEDMDLLRKEISKIDAELKSYNSSIQVLNDNYEELINEYEEKVRLIKDQLDKCDVEIGEWNEMSELFSKTLRYNLLESLIPHINKSISFFINKLDQSYKLEFDQEFKAHIFVDGWEKEISYNNLSTGQRKSLDLAIIFGILQNVIASVDFNIIILDELMSNMDANTRNVMLALLKETFIDKDDKDKLKSIFIVNHAEMNDDYFSHKVRVKLENKKINVKNKKEIEEVLIKASKYELIF